MEERTFSLLEEPWICVITSDGCTAKRSLTQTLLQAHQIRDLAGESKTQDSAMLRLLLGVVYAVFLRKDERGQPEEITNVQEALRRWSALWDLGGLPPSSDSGISGLLAGAILAISSGVAFLSGPGPAGHHKSCQKAEWSAGGEQQ